MLTERERSLLKFEAHHRRNTGAKQDLIAKSFGMTSVRYYSTINTLMDRADALEAMPAEVHLMRARRDKRVAKRAARVLS